MSNEHSNEQSNEHEQYMEISSNIQTNSVIEVKMGAVSSKNSKGYIQVTPSSGVATSDASFTYDKAVKECRSRGLLLASNTESLSSVGLAIPYIRFVSGHADGDVSEIFPCVRNHGTDLANFTKVAEKDSYQCIYRFREGLFDTMMYGKLPGTAFWKGSFINSERKSLTDVSQVLNDFFYYVWYTGGTDDGAPYVPAGRLYIGGARLEGSRETRLDMDPNPNDPTVAGEQTVKTAQRMVLLCESQEYKRGDYTVSSNQKKSTQPWFVQGWEDDTWIQTNWYIIFAPIAGVILLLIIIVTIFCLCKRTKQVPTNYIASSMVLRERVGKGYAYEDDSDEISNEEEEEEE
ncbi:IGP family C-type lectin domain containing protein, putative [Angomonas deanei]|uniref:IGP family C-type lectin domain containing protein, putative n=1 Tax=Angomonas deanei TaxID=59799 RepID=A0A7G2CL38_9TRYP|nr:IGP family C-type lectin domain containing protein, putative [Angomonas deanei]